MFLNKEKEEVYIKLGINMPYKVMCMYYKGEELYKRMLLDIIFNRYKPINRIIINNNKIQDENNDKKNLDISNGKIYKIVSKNTNKIYIGSTYVSLEDRLKKHINDYENYKICKQNYISSFEILKHNEFNIELIEELGCINRQELCKKESEYINNNISICVNIQVPITKKLLYDNSEEKEKRRIDKNKFMLEDTYKYVIDNNININSMEDMYIVYMERKKKWYSMGMDVDVDVGVYYAFA